MGPIRWNTNDSVRLGIVDTPDRAPLESPVSDGEIMSFALISTLLVFFPPLPQEEEKPLGPKVVQMRGAYYYTAPNRASAGPLALYGDKVTVTAIESGFAKITKQDGS